MNAVLQSWSWICFHIVFNPVEALAARQVARPTGNSRLLPICHSCLPSKYYQRWEHHCEHVSILMLTFNLSHRFANMTGASCLVFCFVFLSSFIIHQVLAASPVSITVVKNVIRDFDIIGLLIGAPLGFLLFWPIKDNLTCKAEKWNKEKSCINTKAKAENE